MTAGYKIPNRRIAVQLFEEAPEMLKCHTLGTDPIAIIQRPASFSDDGMQMAITAQNSLKSTTYETSKLTTTGHVESIQTSHV